MQHTFNTQPTHMARTHAHKHTHEHLVHKRITWPLPDLCSFERDGPRFPCATPTEVHRVSSPDNPASRAQRPSQYPFPHLAGVVHAVEPVNHSVELLRRRRTPLPCGDRPQLSGGNEICKK